MTKPPFRELGRTNAPIAPEYINGECTQLLQRRAVVRIAWAAKAASTDRKPLFRWYQVKTMRLSLCPP